MAEEVEAEEQIARWLRSAVSVGLLWVSVFFLAVFVFNRGGRANTDRLALTLTVLEIFLAVIAVGGFFLFRREVRDRAAEVAQQAAPEAVRAYMDEHGGALVRRCLDDAEVVAQLERRFRELGIDDAEDADLIEQDGWDDEERREADDDE